MDIVPQFVCDDSAALEDKGRLHAVWSCDGAWTTVTNVTTASGSRCSRVRPGMGGTY